LFDSKRTIYSPDWGGYSYVVNGSLLYQGQISVNNGAFHATVPIPKDVTFGSQSRIAFYAIGDSADAAGYTENVSINGTDSTAATDTTGPRISIYLDNYSFQSGDVVNPNPTLLVKLFDESGINTSTAGIGHLLAATISNPEHVLDLTDYYRSDRDTYKSGLVSYSLSGLADGKHTLLVKAWDIYNNSSQADVQFDVRSSTGLAIFDMVNYPNPFAHSTFFTFQRNAVDPIDVEVKVYSQAGRLLNDLMTYSITDRFVQIPWNGRDKEGSELANGIYFYKVIVRSSDHQNSLETIGKLAVMR
jgi:hypothetical protein